MCVFLNEAHMYRGPERVSGGAYRPLIAQQKAVLDQVNNTKTFDLPVLQALHVR